MLGRWIPFVGFKPVFRITLGQSHQFCIPGDFGNDGGCGYRRYGFVALHDGFSGDPKIWHFVAIDQHMVWSWAKTLNGSSHGQMAGL
jgi:hypothetical protein